MSELKLLNCPFCGGEVVISDEKIDATREVYNFHCHNCDMVTFYDFPNDKEKAIETWNTRTPMANIVEKLEALKNGASGCNGVMCENCEYNDICFDGEQSFKVTLDNAINIVKQEMNNGLE